MYKKSNRDTYDNSTLNDKTCSTNEKQNSSDGKSNIKVQLKKKPKLSTNNPMTHRHSDTYARSADKEMIKKKQFELVTKPCHSRHANFNHNKAKDHTMPERFNYQ